MTNLNLRIYFVLLIVGVTGLDSLDAGQELNHVFILHSYHQGYLFSDKEMSGIEDAFGKSGITVETYVIYMDAKRIPPSSQYFSNLKELIKEGYKGIHFDAVLACDNDALAFMRTYRDELFPEVPVVFAGINDYDNRMLDKRRDITGTIESTDYAGTISIALKLCPATKNIVVVTDNTTTGKLHRSAVEKIRPDLMQSLGFTYISLADMTLDELAQKLSKLSSDTIVLLLHHFVDRNGTDHTIKESTSLFAKSSSVPVFVVNDSRMGFGALGGHLVSGYSQGETAAQMVLKILSGTDVRTIPVLLDSPNRFIFDYRVMQRFGIAEHDLPQGSILINKPVSVLAKYKPYLFTIFGVFIILCGFVAYLLLEIRRRIQVQEKLRESEEKFRTIADYTYDWENWVGHDGKLMWVNPAVERLTGYSVEECFTMSDFPMPIIAETDRDKVAMEFAKAVHGIDTNEFDFRICCKDGSIKWMAIVYQPIHNASGTNTGYRSSIRDITDRKLYEEALRISEQHFRTIFEEAHLGIVIVSPSFTFTEANSAFCLMMGYSSEELRSKTLADITHPDYIKQIIENVKKVEQGEILFYKTEKKYITKNGETLWGEVIFSSILDGHGKLLYYLNIINDITNRKLAEDQIKSLLAEKELLLQEVHHRIKNHMTVIMSILSIQKSMLKDPLSIAALEDSRSRVQNMMVLYDKLYRLKDFRALSAKEYLTSLVNEIVDNFPNRAQVVVETQIDDVSLGIKTISPVGMILNELLTNTLKHAFIGRETGLIGVSLSINETHITLTIQDNGIGIPESIDSGASSGFGMQLVEMLTKQLKGTIRLEHEKGTRFILDFEV